MSSQEDFTFPIVSDSFPSSLGSPPLWRLSGDDTDQDDHDYFAPTSTKNSRRRSMSSIESKTRKKMVGKGESEGEEEEEEEKMDMLWEDLNEDLYMSSSASRSLNDDTNNRTINKNESSCYTEMAEFNGGCVRQYKTLRLSKTNNKAVISTGKPGVVVIVKFLKKLFLFHNNHRPPRRHQW